MANDGMSGASTGEPSILDDSTSHVHMDEFGDASRETGVAAAGAVRDIAEADVDLFQKGHLHGFDAGLPAWPYLRVDQ